MTKTHKAEKTSLISRIASALKPSSPKIETEITSEHLNELMNGYNRK